MKVDCSILGVNQRVDFERGEVVSTVIIELEPGVELELEASGDKSDFLIKYYSARTAGLDLQQMQEQEAEPPPPEPAPPVPLITAAAPARSPQFGSRMVGKDSMGNPVMRPAPEPPTASMEEDVDEDGVQQA